MKVTDLTTVPDEVLFAEVGRRRALMRQTHSGGRNGGRPRKVYTCAHCNAELQGRAGAMAHKCLQRG